MRFPLTSIALAALVLSAGCSADQAASAKSAPSAGAGGTEVVATVDGAEIRRDELDQRASGRLAAVRQQEYEVRQEVLNDIVLEKLIEKEAKARGVSKEALLKSEIDDKVGKPSTAEIDALYERARNQLGGRTKQEVLPEMESYLRTQKLSAERQRFHEMLKSRSKIVVRLEAPRVAVAVPADAPSIGPAAAPVTIVEFTDYQCPYCHRAQGTVDELLAKYGDKLRFVHQDFPLETHPRAFFASRASRCANDQGKYWDYHRGLLKEPSDFSDADLVRRAQQIGLDVGGFKTCVESGKHDTAIRAAHKLGQELGVTGTPSFFVNGRPLNGARPRQQFEQIIDQELAAN
jgi:protein-disulfide isomerase